jgi:hypothetical protein
MESYPDSREAFGLAKKNKRYETLIGGVGGFLVGYYALGPLLSNQDPNLTGAGVGLTLVAVSIPLDAAFRRHTKKAIELYNFRIAGE